MVAPYFIGQAVRSSVRIPGSGTDRQARPVLLDLSNVSPLVASFQIPLPMQRPRFRPCLSRPTPKADQPNHGKTDSPCGQVTSMSNVPKESSNNAGTETNAKRKRQHSDNRGEELNKPLSPLAAKRERREEIGTFQSPVQVETAFTPNLYNPKRIIFVQATQTQLPRIQQAQRIMVPVSITFPARNGVLNSGSTKRVTSMVYTGSPQRANAMNLQSADRTLPQDQQNKTPLPAVPLCSGNPSFSLLELSQEICGLKRKNIFLYQRLKTFQNIFKSKERLRFIANSVAQTL